MHAIRIYYNENVSRLEMQGVNILQPVVEKRLEAVTILGTQILKLEEMLADEVAALI